MGDIEGVIAVVGAGRMGRALVAGMVRSGLTGPDRIVCTTANEESARALEQELGVRATTDNRAAVGAGRIVVLALKPQVLLEQLGTFGDAIGAHHTVVSVAAGVTTAAIENVLGPGIPVVRVMTNTPVTVASGMSALAGGSHAGAAHLDEARRVLGSVGRVVTVDEDQLDAVTAVSGSGPAYVFLFAEALAAAGVEQGLEPDLATELVIQTLLGSARMLEQRRDPESLRDEVTSPGGTTAAALDAFERAGLRGIVADAVRAARRRGRELGSA